MAKGPGVSVTSHIIATSQNNIHYYIEKIGALQAFNYKTYFHIFLKFKNSIYLIHECTLRAVLYYIFSVTDLKLSADAAASDVASPIASIFMVRFRISFSAFIISSVLTLTDCKMSANSALVSTD